MGRWSGRFYPGARREDRESKRLEAVERNADTEPGRRSTKRRVRRAKGTAPASRQEAA